MALLVGDVDDGQLTLEESLDGKRISATWVGEVVEGSCAREIRAPAGRGPTQEPPARPHRPVPFVAQTDSRRVMRRQSSGGSNPSQ